MDHPVVAKSSGLIDNIKMDNRSRNNRDKTLVIFVVPIVIVA